MKKELIYPDECYAIRGAIYEVHNEMGSGFKEEVYQQCLERELDCRGIPFDAKRGSVISFVEIRVPRSGIRVLAGGESPQG